MSEKRFVIERVELATCCPGSWYDPDKANKELICKTLELPWLDNKPNVSCIPYGVHRFKKMPPGFGRDYAYCRAFKVAGRGMNQMLNMSTILIHPITYVKDLKGCIGVGSRFADLNADGIPDMVESKKKLAWMMTILPETFEIEIIKKP